MIKNGERRAIPFTKLIPNFLTLLGLMIGISSIRFALDSRWEFAVYCIIIAGIIDGLDGRIARLLNASSRFGAELDSLCDFVNFGLSPALIIYLWSFQQFEYKLLSWSSLLLFVICMAIRLARFNTNIDYNDTKEIKKSYNTGVPAPCGAVLALTPLILDFELSSLFGMTLRSHTILIDIYMAIMAMLLASRLPTFSFKNLRIKPEYLSLSMILFGMITINLILYPWYFLPFLSFLYLLSIPVCFRINKRDKLLKSYDNRSLEK